MIVICTSFLNAFAFKKNTGTIFNSNTIPLDFPILPRRPSFKDLYHSLSVPVIEENFELNKVKVKSDPALFLMASETNLDKELNNLIDKKFNVAPEKLFFSSLNAVKALNLAIKYLDISEKKIVIIDKNRNTILLSILSNDSVSSNVKIAGYASVGSKDALAKSAKQLISLISEKTK